MTPSPLAGVGIGWREELAGFVGRRGGPGSVEVVAESIHDDQPLPTGLEELTLRGVPVVPHGVRLSLASAGEPDPARVGHLAGWPGGWGRRWSASMWPSCGAAGWRPVTCCRCPGSARPSAS
jgi:Protein of unknown function (DUF692)